MSDLLITRIDQSIGNQTFPSFSFIINVGIESGLPQLDRNSGYQKTQPKNEKLISSTHFFANCIKNTKNVLKVKSSLEIINMSLA